MDLQEVLNKDRYLMPSAKRLFTKDPFCIVSGKGATVTDSSGKEYIDLFGMHAVVAIGHNHPDVVAAIKKQADELIFVPTDFNTKPAADLAERLVQINPFGLTRCYFGNSGAEANEVALYLARKFTKRYEIISLFGGFHGRTYGTRSALGWSQYKSGMGPYLPGFIQVPAYYCYRCSLGLDYPGCDLQCAKMLEDVLAYGCSGDVAAFIAEPIQGTRGNIPPPDGYFPAVKKILDAHDILLIADEIVTGLGRTGKILCMEHYNVRPDIVTLAKALGGGVPISAAMCTEEVSKAFELPFTAYFTTYGSNPLSCAAALAAVNVILRDKLHERSVTMGEYFMKRANELAEKHELIGDVRGKGLMIGIELVKDRRSKEPARAESIKIREEARKKGLLLPSGMGWLGNVIRLTPPMVITRDQIDRTIDVLDDTLRETK